MSETYVRSKEGIGSVLISLSELLGDLCGSHSIPELDKSLGRIWHVRNTLFQRHQDDNLCLAFIACCKGGKSTLINALVGDELLPVNNVPETARICKVVHSERAQQPFLVEPASLVAPTPQSKRPSHSGSGVAVEQAFITSRGGPAIRARLQELNRAVRGHDSLSTASSSASPLFTSQQLPQSMPYDQEFPVEAEAGTGGTMTTDRNLLAIHTHIAALHSFAEGGKGKGKKWAVPVCLHLLDTPGPNEAGEAALRHQVERLLGTVDAAVYLLDYTKLKTEDEAAMIERLKEVNPALVQRLSLRLFVAVNKVDASLVSEGQDADATRQYVAELVTRQMNCEGFQLMPEQVLLLSARNALLSRRVLMDGWPKAGDASAATGGSGAAETRARFAQLAFGRFASPAAISPEAAIAAAHALLEDSGVPELEAQVLAHLYNHSGSIKQLALVDDLGRLLAEVRNVSASCAAALTAGAESLEASTRALRVELVATLQAFDGVHTHADAITTGVTAEVRAHLQTLRGRLFSHIISALDTSSPPQTTSSSSMGSGTSASSWQRVRERFVSIFTSPRIHAVPGAQALPFSHAADGSFSSTKDAMLAAAGAVVARSRSKSELAVLLEALHKDITQQIHAEVTEFWSVLETVASARHAELLGVLNKHLQDLSAKVESAVSCSLDVKLSPVKLALEPQSIDQFHCSLEALIAAGVVESRERHIRVGQRQVHERIKRPSGGICRWGHYWEEVPRTRTVVEAYTMSVYELAPAEITKQFVTMVDSAISFTESQLEAYVSKFVGDQLAQARQQLENYSQSYLGTMTSALEVSHLGAEHRLAALSKVQAVLERVESLGTDVAALLAVVEKNVPRSQEPCIAFDNFDELEFLGAHEAASACDAAAAVLPAGSEGQAAEAAVEEQQQDGEAAMEHGSSGARQWSKVVEQWSLAAVEEQEQDRGEVGTQEDALQQESLEAGAKAGKEAEPAQQQQQQQQTLDASSTSVLAGAAEAVAVVQKEIAVCTGEQEGEQAESLASNDRKPKAAPPSLSGSDHNEGGWDVVEMEQQSSDEVLQEHGGKEKKKKKKEEEEEAKKEAERA